ncbi:hypothetical protein EHS25_000199 [Saitozyma podzolica]|uniref:Uncharacterized protein n=1 Tax=Saitozyma podzolica TaxID=1890683 RepID=A0A427YVE9_9TREE|nr:hypothetical protein EHS25_000199 [Saitozyma podzolica]
MSTGSGPLFRGILSSVYTSSTNRAARHPFFSAVPTRYLLLQDVPKTARASDVLRALKDSGTVAKSFPLSAITPQPPSYPRYPSLTRTFHLTAPTLSVANAIQERLRKAPIFPSLRVVDPGPISRQSDATPPPRVIFSTSDAKIRLEAEIEIEIMQILYLSVTIEMTLWTERETLLVDVMSHAQGEDLPSVRSRAIRFGMATYDSVRKIAKNFGMLDGEEGCVRMPRSPHGVKAIFCFTVDSVSNAHRLQKFLHLSNFNRHMYGFRYPMQAEVW